MTLYLEAYYTPIKVSPPPNTSNNPTMSQPATISTSTPALDASTSTLVDELLKVIIDIGLTREEHEGLAHEIEKLATRRIEEGRFHPCVNRRHKYGQIPAHLHQ